MWVKKCREHFSKKENSNEYVIDSVYVVVQFHPLFKFYFPLFQTH